jgi:amidase
MIRPLVAALCVLLALCPAALSQGPATARPVDLSGGWVLYLVGSGEKFDPARVQLKEDGNRVVGTLNELKLVGTIRAQSVDLTVTRANGDEFGKLKIEVVGAELRGTLKRGTVETNLEMHRIGGEGMPPQIRTFMPTAYSRVFAETVGPVLHINPGDTIKTTTVDAGGFDEKGVSRSLGGNPQTGPFYVEGALPGDTLAIKINRLHLNRPSASSTSSIVPVALTADYYRNAQFDDKVSGEWKLDLDHGTASLSNPTERLENFKIDLRPMLGCVAVAPGNKASFRTAWLGPWGGNMDYRGVREGTTVYLPVAQEGALLYVGDAHAQQGDGELNGNALETSVDVEFTVNVIPCVSTSGPRAENDEYLMSMGIAGSVDNALKLATTQLAQWIESEYKLTPNEAAIVLGTSIHYEIAEVVDPQVNVVAKVKKAALAQILK